MIKKTQELIDLVEQEILEHKELNKENVQLRLRTAGRWVGCQIKDRQKEDKIYKDLIVSFSSIISREKRRQITTEAYSYFDSQGIDCQVAYLQVPQRT